MSRKLHPFALFVGAVTVLYVLQDVARDSYAFTAILTPGRVGVFGSLAKMAAQVAGAVYAARCAARYEKGNPSRGGWILMSASLGGWFAGQVVLAGYERVFGFDAPVPSLGDAFFFLGYVSLIAALWTFVRAYRRSGFAAGSGSQDGLLALGACAVFAVVGYVVLVPVAIAPTPLAERAVNVGYPVFDLLTLIPALVLLRITLGFRGGGVWHVWAALLAGIVFWTVADIVFADVTPAHVAAVGPLVDLTTILGYAFGARGTWLQYRMLTE
jgi:hypothetical protein